MEVVVFRAGWTSSPLVAMERSDLQDRSLLAAYLPVSLLAATSAARYVSGGPLFAQILASRPPPPPRAPRCRARSSARSCAAAPGRPARAWSQAGLPNPVRGHAGYLCTISWRVILLRNSRG